MALLYHPLQGRAANPADSRIDIGCRAVRPVGACLGVHDVAGGIHTYRVVPEYSIRELRDSRTCYRQGKGNGRVGKQCAAGAAAGREIFGGAETLSESGIQNNRHGQGPFSNRTYISAFINREYGVNFNRFINNYRLQEVERLQSEVAHRKQKTSMLEIVIHAGFSNYRSYFRAKNMVKNEAVSIHQKI